MILMESSLIKVQYVTKAKWTMCTTNYSRIEELQCPPLSPPQKKIKKENIFLIPHRGCLTPGKTCKSYVLKKHSPAIFKAFIQHSRRTQSINKRSRKEWGKCSIILGSLWLVYHISHRTRYRRSFKWSCLSSGSFCCPSRWQQEL